MRAIMPPAKSGPYPDRHLHLQMLMEERFSALLDDAVAAGWALDEVATAMVELADNQVLMIMANVETDDEIARAIKGR